MRCIVYCNILSKIASKACEPVIYNRDSGIVINCYFTNLVVYCRRYISLANGYMSKHALYLSRYSRATAAESAACLIVE